jgi:hypothetical protein
MRKASVVRAFNTFITAGVATALFAGVTASASIIPVLVSGPTSNGSGAFIYNYSANLQQEERLDPAATNGVTCPAPASRVQCNPTGTFFTLYDFFGFQSATAPAGWSVNTQLSGVTPSTVNSAPFDDPTIVNVSFFYTGPVVHAGASVVPIPGFLITSSTGVTTQGVFSSQATIDIGPSIGNTDQTVGPILVPSSGRGGQGNVPEPATATLLGSGFLLMLASAAFRRSRKA